MEPVTSARGLTGTDSRAGGEAAENRTDLLHYGRHQPSETGARNANRVHNSGTKARLAVWPTSCYIATTSRASRFLSMAARGALTGMGTCSASFQRRIALS